MMRHDVEKIILKYVPYVAPLFADKFERWSVAPDANKLSDALYGMERTYRSLIRSRMPLKVIARADGQVREQARMGSLFGVTDAQNVVRNFIS